MQLASFVILVAVAAQTVAGAGINCHGLGHCGLAYLGGGRLSDFHDIFDKIDDDRIYNNNEPLGCIQVSSVDLFKKLNITICAFLQNSGENVPGSYLRRPLDHLIENKCGLCGTVPIFYNKGQGDGEHGELAFNVVDSIPANCTAGVPCPAK